MKIYVFEVGEYEDEYPFAHIEGPDDLDTNALIDEFWRLLDRKPRQFSTYFCELPREVVLERLPGVVLSFPDNETQHIPTVFTDWLVSVKGLKDIHDLVEYNSIGIW